AFLHDRRDRRLHLAVQGRRPAPGQGDRGGDLTMDGVTLSAISLGILMILLSVGVPIAFCFSGALLFMILVGEVSMKGMMMWGLQQILSPALLCIPLFIYAGGLMSDSGIAKRLLEFV